MPGELFDRHDAGAGIDHAGNRARIADADGVAERDFVAAHVEEDFRHFGGFLRRHDAFVGTADDTGNIAAHRDCQRRGGGNHRLEALQAFRNRTVDVLLREGLRGGAENRHFIRAGRDGAVETLQVRRQRSVGHARPALDAGQHDSVVAHLRHPFRRDEGGRLDHRQPGRGQALDQFDLGFARDDLFFVLQAVARADFDDFDVGGEDHGESLGESMG